MKKLFNSKINLYYFFSLLLAIVSFILYSYFSEYHPLDVRSNYHHLVLLIAVTVYMPALIRNYYSFRLDSNKGFSAKDLKVPRFTLVTISLFLSISFLFSFFITLWMDGDFDRGGGVSLWVIFGLFAAGILILKVFFIIYTIFTAPFYIFYLSICKLLSSLFKRCKKINFWIEIPVLLLVCGSIYVLSYYAIFRNFPF